MFVRPCMLFMTPPVTIETEVLNLVLFLWQALFTGDHLMYSAQLGRLSIARYDVMQVPCPL